MNFEKFDQLSVCGELLFGIQDMGFETPTAVQASVIPLILEGKDVLATAPTGTGKTCAFGIPMIEKIDKLLDKTQALVVCPTRELAMQITEELKKLTKHLPEIRTVSVYGGENIGKQLAHLRRKPQIVVGTPGRIMDHLRRRTLKLDMLTTFVLDEADEMLNMGFREDIDVIAKACPKYRQTVLFSATMPKEIQMISLSYQTNPESIVIERKNEDMPKIKQIGIRATFANKDEKLLELLKEVDFNLAVIFCNTKRRVDKLKGILKEKEYRCDGLHSDIRQAVRTKIMKRFRGGEIEILLATDVAARGIDVENVDVIINYDLPMDEEYYVHRIGRTGRAKKEGVAYSFYQKDEIIRMNKYAKCTQGHIDLDPDDVVANIDDYSIKTGRIMQPKKKSKGRNRTEMRGKEEADKDFSGEKQNSRGDRNRDNRKSNDKNRSDRKPSERAQSETSEKVKDGYERRKANKKKGEYSENREFQNQREHHYGRYESFEKPEENKKPARKKEYEKREPKSESAPRRERSENTPKREKNERSESSQRRERKGGIDSYGEKAPTKKSGEFKPKKDFSKGKSQSKSKGKKTTFAGTKTTKKHDKKINKKSTKKY